jgi:myo-inositol 2-dehydrogenase/D-chiro-inositol 1-dehydrogenase
METANQNLHRRSFIKTSAALAGVTLLSQWSLAGAYAAGSDVIKVAVVGCGGRGTGAAFDAIATGANIQIVALADAFLDRLEEAYSKLMERHPDKMAVTTETKFVGFDAYKHAIDLADVVILATSPGFRPIHFEEAVRQGKHVFMEKPVAVDVLGIRRVLEAAKIAKQKKLNVVVGLQRRYQKSYQEAIKRINDGMIGEIVSGQVYWNSGGVWVRPRQEGQSEMEYQMRNWYYFNWLCGDHIVEQHVHNIDVANWVKNAYPVKIQGTGSRAWRTGKDHGEIYDNHAVELTYADGAVVYSQCRHFEGTSNRVDETFQGTKGKVFLNSGHTAILWDNKGNVLYEHPKEGNANPYQLEHVELFDAVTKGEFRHMDADYGAYSTLTGIIGRLATYSGQVITWEEALQSQVDLMPEHLDWDALPKVVPNADGYYPYAIPGQTVVL